MASSNTMQASDHMSAGVEYLAPRSTYMMQSTSGYHPDFGSCSSTARSCGTAGSTEVSAALTAAVMGWQALEAAPSSAWCRSKQRAACWCRKSSAGEDGRLSARRKLPGCCGLRIRRQQSCGSHAAQIPTAVDSDILNQRRDQTYLCFRLKSPARRLQIVQRARACVPLFRLLVYVAVLVMLTGSLQADQKEVKA